MNTIKIMGAEWKIDERSSQEDARLDENLGYCDPYSKLIVVSDMKDYERDRMAVGDLCALQKKVLRHEIIHAFLSECGLLECSDWATDEEMVDWFAVQFHKLAALFNEVGV